MFFEQGSHGLHVALGRTAEQRVGFGTGRQARVRHRESASEFNKDARRELILAFASIACKPEFGLV
jgi:hypothetical protein